MTIEDTGTGITETVSANDSDPLTTGSVSYNGASLDEMIYFDDFKIEKYE